MGKKNKIKATFCSIVLVQWVATPPGGHEQVSRGLQDPSAGVLCLGGILYSVYWRAVHTTKENRKDSLHSQCFQAEVE